jgi:hypothetical protein
MDTGVTASAMFLRYDQAAPVLSTTRASEENNRESQRGELYPVERESRLPELDSGVGDELSAMTTTTKCRTSQANQTPKSRRGEKKSEESSQRRNQQRKKLLFSRNSSGDLFVTVNETNNANPGIHTPNRLSKRDKRRRRKCVKFEWVSHKY